MRYVVQRLGFRLSRGWVILILAVGALIATAFWIGPFRPLPPDLRLVALGGDGYFRGVVGMPESWADTAPPQPDVRARFPVVLAVYNAGARAARPVRLSVSVPARFQLSNSAGQEYAGRVTAGNPLVQYIFDVNAGRIAPGQLPRVLTSLDTLWLEPLIPSYYCTTFMDSIPEFVPAPAQSARALSRVHVYYSFEAGIRDRQTGILTIQLPPRLLEREPPPAPPAFPTTIMKPRAIRPAMSALALVGSRTAYCGDPGTAMELYTTLWETQERGRFFVLYYGGAPRKYLFDLNRDSLIELEIWDRDSDGTFESTRPARLTIPEFLLPPRAVLAKRDTMVADSTRLAAATTADSIAVAEFQYPAAIFFDTEAGPFRFWRTRTDAQPAPAESAGVGRARTGVTDPGTREQFQFTPAVFHDTDAGPLRFWRTEQRARGLPVDTVRPRPRRSEPRLLGRPVPGYQPPARRDTLSTSASSHPVVSAGTVVALFGDITGRLDNGDEQSTARPTRGTTAE